MHSQSSEVVPSLKSELESDEGIEWNKSNVWGKEAVRKIR